MMGWKIIRASGDSMAPILCDGDYLITKKPKRLTAGDICVVDHADLGNIVKQLTGQENNRYRFSGTNPASTPCAIIGLVEARRITGIVVLVIGKAGIKKL